MVRGRKPMAAEVHDARGTYNQHPERKNKSRPNKLEGCVRKPDVVLANDVASAKWDELVVLLSEMQVLSPSDADLLEAYCITYAMYRKALVDVNRTGQVLVRRLDGNQVEVKRSPFSVELHKYMDRLQKLMAEMGLTPSSRSRIVVPKQGDDDDPMEALLARMGASNN